MRKFIILFLLSLVTIELSGYILSALRIEPTGYKLYADKEWLDARNAYADRDTIVGVWHLPNDRWLQNGPCFTTEMTSNQYGARDNSWDTTKQGYLFLGSSFIEGYGVAYNSRISEYFEQQTKKEVFNCAMSGTFTPVQYYMTLHKFKDILKFDTCFVFFILPNDESSIAKKDNKRYRPYLINDSIVYTRSKTLFPEKKDMKEKLQLFVQQYSYAYHLYEYSKNRNLLKSRLVQTTVKEESDRPTDRTYKGISKIMNRFASDFPQKQFFFVLLPTLNASGPEVPEVDMSNAKIIDMRNALDPASDYFDCNTHWNEKGHHKAATALYNSIFKRG